MSNFPIFSVLGIEIEYMLVDKNSLNVQPKSDLILSALAGQLVNQVELGDIAISNELVMHVLELKNNGPQPPQAPIAEQFQKIINDLQPLLDQHNLLLLPTGSHPWMDPQTETKRWPHGNNAVYKQFDAIFNKSGNLEGCKHEIIIRNGIFSLDEVKTLIKDFKRIPKVLEKTKKESE